ncbi:MAG TPA: hypothetical protein DCF73_07125, partial [Rhodobiaceae bacterium]|nr:hypothetical protein [Rhodobiaceae bacterium]
GLAGLRAAYEAMRKEELREGDDPTRKEARLQRFEKLIGRIERCVAPLVDAMKARREAASLVLAHAEAAEHLAATAEEKGVARLWKGEAGEAGSDFIRELAEAA